MENPYLIVCEEPHQKAYGWPGKPILAKSGQITDKSKKVV